jgi:circadian clock protein KaiC
LRDGPEALVSLVEDLIRTKRPKLLVIDSFKAVHDLAESESQMRRICFALGAVLSAYDITTFLVGEYEDEDVATQPEFAVADGIVQLERRASYARDERYLRVLKLRGSPYAEGAHALTISSAGIQVYPRLVSPREPRDYEPLMERIGTGDEGLDAITGGGLWRGSTTLVQGSAGTGKTTLALGFVLAGVQQGEPSLYLHLQENPIQLGQTIAALGKDVDDLQKEGLYLRYLSPVELKIDSVVLELRDVIEKHGIQRVAIDALTEVRWASSSQDRFHDFVYALGQHFRVHQVTALLTLEIPPGSYAIHGQPQSRVSTLCDGLISLKVVDGEAPERRIRVVKMRGSAHPLESRPFKIRDTGVVVAPGADG